MAWTDEQLFHRLRAGDTRAFDELYARFERRLFGFILIYVKNREDAEEIFHDVFQAVIAAARRGERVAPSPERFDAWLFTIARNRSLNRVRGKRDSPPLEMAFAAKPALESDDEESAEQKMLTAERSLALAKAVSQLPVKLNDVYKLRLAGQSYDEMARRLDVPVGTVKSRINALVQRLKEEMSQWLAT